MVNLDDVMLSDISQLQKDKHCTSPLPNTVRVPGVVRFKETKVDWQLPRTGGMGDGMLLFNGYRVSVLQDDKSSGD